MSVISKVEVLGYHDLSTPKLIKLQELFDTFSILPISNAICNIAIELRQIKKISLGDSIIAATALLHNLSLITVNDKDFRWIKMLEIENPINPN